MRKLFFLNLLLGAFGFSGFTQQRFEINSPDEKIRVEFDIGRSVAYRLYHDNDLLIDTSPLFVRLASGIIWGKNAAVKRVTEKKESSNVPMLFGTTKSLDNRYNELLIEFREGWALLVRVYDEGFGYRILNQRKETVTIMHEDVAITFPGDFNTLSNYVAERSGNSVTKERQLNKAFENTYTHLPLSKLDTNRLIQLPLLVEAVNGKKICITEADLESYPGMYLNRSPDNTSALTSYFAAYPKKTQQGGFRNVQIQVTERENFIAKVPPDINLPWRVFIVAKDDKELLTSELVYKLAAPSRIEDTSWIEPGQVAWDWWHDRNLLNVGFETGMNTATYKYYIDFAAQNDIKYIIIDEGWSDPEKADLMQVVSTIDLKELVDFANRKGVGIILWAGYWAFDRDMENVCKHYADMGIRGFKVDYMNRDDQQMVDFIYRAAATAAKYQLVLNFHGMYKPTGIQRTYPNVLNFEGVVGLEYMKFKWGDSLDMVTNDVTIPFIRMVAGPLDYTPGAMRNGAKDQYVVNRGLPMSQGTRSRQLAMYIIYKAPMQVLSDSPSAYLEEEECFDFIKTVPVVWDHTVALGGAVQEYVMIARQKGRDWWIGGMTNWSAREVEVDLAFLPSGSYQMECFIDGVNAEKWGNDYCKETKGVVAGEKLRLKMKAGGGFAIRLTKND